MGGLSFTKDRNNIFFRCVEDSNEAIMLTDAKGILIYVNPAWTKIYGYTPDEALGKSPGILHSGFQDRAFYDAMWADIRDEKKMHWKNELTNRAKDGTLVPVLLNITPFKDEEGMLQGYMGIALDLRHKKELEAKVSQQDRLASVGMLASGLAHEIGTPLGVIRGRAEILLMQSQNPQMTKYLNVIVTQIDRISKLIRSLLRISRSQTDISLKNYSLIEVVDEVSALVDEKLKKDHISISIQIEKDLKANYDFNRLEQVLLNLLMNSVHAIIKAKEQNQNDNSHKIELKGYSKGSYVFLEISDSGCGISPENMKKLFKPFFTTKPIGEGTGLGLAIVAQIMSEMNGEISATSTLNEGTCFTIRLNPTQ